MDKTQKMALIGLASAFVVGFTYWIQETQITTSPNELMNNSYCHDSFETFAYFMPETLPSEVLLPRDPWEPVSSIPVSLMGDYHSNGFQLGAKFARYSNNTPEIWFSRPNKNLQDNVSSVFVYRPDTKQWHSVESIIENTGIFISDIFISNDSTIWGINQWSWGDVSPSEGPILSRFDESTQKFQFEERSPMIAYNDEQQFVNIETIVDNKNNLWFLISGDGIYKLSLSGSQSMKVADFPDDFDVANATISTDGIIFFQNLNYDLWSKQMPLNSLYDGLTYQFDTVAQELTQLETPDQLWPQGTPYVTQNNELWIGANGFRSLNDSSWNLFHPDTAYFFDLPPLTAHSPEITLESSNGLYWFEEYVEGIEGSGVAWYEPVSKQGCLVTNVRSLLIEDEQKNLWMLVNDTLYSASID